MTGLAGNLIGGVAVETETSRRCKGAGVCGSIWGAFLIVGDEIRVFSSAVGAGTGEFRGNSDNLGLFDGDRGARDAC